MQDRILKTILVFFLLCVAAFAGDPVNIQDPSNANNKAGVTNGALNVNVVAGGGGGGGVVSGTVAVSNFPTTQAVSLSGSNVVLTGTFVTTSGTIPSGTQRYSLTVSGTNTATITIGSYALSSSGVAQYSKTPLGNGNTYPAIPYTISGSAWLDYDK